MSDEEFLARASPEGSAGGEGPVGGGAGAAIPPELQSLEAALAALRPATPGLDRDRLMFVAGQASVTPRSQGWWRAAWRHVVPLAAAAAAAVLVTAWVWQPEPQIVERIVYLPAPQPPTVAADASRTDESVGRPQSPDSGPAPIASSAFGRPEALPTWLTSWLGMGTGGAPGLLRRRAVVEEHYESLAAHPEASCPPESARPASPSPSAAEPTMSRQSLGRLLNDLTQHGRSQTGSGVVFGRGTNQLAAAMAENDFRPLPAEHRTPFHRSFDRGIQT